MNSFYQSLDKGSSDEMSNVMPVISRDTLQQMLMEIPAMLCVLKGPEFIIVMENEPCHRITGMSQMTGKKLSDVIPGLEKQGYMNILREVYHTGLPFTGEELPVEIVTANGITETIYLNINYQVFNDHDDSVRSILFFGYDVTERVLSKKKIGEAEENYRNLLMGLPTALYTCDTENNILLYNEAALKLWNHEPSAEYEKIESLKYLDKDGNPLEYAETPMGKALKGIIDNNEIQVERPDGTRIHLVPYPQLIYDTDGKIKGSVNVFVDITSQVNALKELEQNGAMIENLFMNAPAFICSLKGPHYQFELINPEFQKLFGTRKLDGKEIAIAIPELKGQGLIEGLNQVYKTGIPVVVTEQLVYISRKEGFKPEATYLNFSYQPMYDHNKKIDGILVFGYEVTEQVLARKRSEENLRLILESLPQITSTSGADGSNIYFNRFFFEYSGLTKDEASEHGWNSILHPDEIADVLAEWENCKMTGRDFYKEVQLKRQSDGKYRWHIAHLTPIKNNRQEIIQWVATATDIHEQKTKEQKKDEFISIASHELKTPLTTVKAYLQLLELSLENAGVEVKLYTKKAIHSVDRLKDLISELLDANKIQHGQLNLNVKTFNFSEMIDSAIDSIQNNATNHMIIKNVNVPVQVEGDQERIQQVVINLLSNAIKYSPDAPFVYLDANLDDEMIKVSIRDTGIGIEKTNLERIFERYYRIAGHDIQFQGLGIGLYISMNIIQQHHGKIWAESKLNTGSTFHFTIPASLKTGSSNKEKSIK